MEDNSYVSLSLEKYNELYDKAKKFDELTKEFGDKLSETINTIIDNVNDMFAVNEEHSGETEEVKDTEFKVGDKVMIVGTIIENDESDIPYKIKYASSETDWFKKEDIKKIKEEK